MRMSNISREAQLLPHYPGFLSKVSQQLQFSPQELESAARIRPTMWGYHAAAVFGEERLPMPYASGLLESPEDMSLLAGKSVVDSRPAYDFRTGEIAQRVEDMRQGSPSERQAASAFIRTSADWLFNVGTTHGFGSDDWRAFMPTLPQAYIKRHPRDKNELVMRGQQE